MNIRSMMEADVDLVVAYLFRKNNQPESSSNFCCKSEEAIRKDLLFLRQQEDSCSLLCEEHHQLIGFIGCFVIKKDKSCDVAGPFFEEIDVGQALIQEAKRILSDGITFSFYFHQDNIALTSILQQLRATKTVDEYTMSLSLLHTHMPCSEAVSLLDEKHKAAYHTLYHALFPDCYMSSEEALASKKRIVWMLLENDVLAGFCITRTDETIYWTEILGIATEYRRRGYAKALLQTAIAKADGSKMSDVYLIVDSDNHKAIPLYLSLGFQIKQTSLHYTL